MELKAVEKVLIFSRYIGQQVVVKCLRNADIESVSIGKLIGVRDNALLVCIDEVNRWIPVYDDIDFCEIRLLLKPLRKLTPEIIRTANNLPVQAFITPYYQGLGFDMPVFVAPNHPCNCKYVHEVGLADHREVEEIYNEDCLALVNY